MINREQQQQNGSKGHLSRLSYDSFIKNDWEENVARQQSFINFSKYRNPKQFFPKKSKMNTAVKPLFHMAQQGKARETDYCTPMKKTMSKGLSPASLSSSIVFRQRSSILLNNHSQFNKINSSQLKNPRKTGPIQLTLAQQPAPKRINEPSPPNSERFMTEDDEVQQADEDPDSYLFQKGRDRDAGRGVSDKLCCYSYMDQKFMVTREFTEAPNPQYLTYDQMRENEIRKDLKYKVSAMIDSQKGMVGEILKAQSAAMPSLWGSSATKKQTYTGLPIKFFEDKTYLERVAEWFTNAPLYLNKDLLTKNREPAFRLQQVVSMALSTLYMTVKPSKPFNPILGETYEGFMCLDQQNPNDIFKIYAEQTSHHPPISNYLIESKLVRIHGHYQLSGSPSGNSYNIKNEGFCEVTFLDTRQKIRFSLPDVSMSGILWGTQSLTLQNSIIFSDQQNSLKCHITFNSDNFQGQLYKFIKNQAILDQNVPLNKVKDIEKSISNISGNWQKNLLIDNQEVWNFQKAKGDIKAIPVPNPLPSDSRNREDLIWVRKANGEHAQVWKYWLEELQRYDAKLRKK